MHIVWINEFAAPVGGCERYIATTVDLLNQRGVRSSLLYDVSGPAEPGYLKRFAGAFPLVDYAEQIRELKPDLVYLHRQFNTHSASALKIGRTPVVRFFHDHKLFCLRDYKYTALRHHTCTRTVGWRCYPCLGFINRSNSWPRIRLSRVGTLRREQQDNQRLDAIVVGSSYMANHIFAHGFSPAKVHVLPLFVRAPAEAADPEIREKDLLLFVGQLIRGKGLDILFRALLISRKPRLLVIGSGRQELMHKALCQRLGLQDRVTFEGKKDPDQLAPYYRRAACLVVPSRSPETFGLVGLEAMSHGTPVIASAVGGIGEWLEEGRTGLSFPSGDSAALAQAIDRLMGNPGLTRAMGQAGRTRVQERFTPERHGEALLKLFQRLCERNRAGV